jgi:TRAP-type uncharacterized transport system substrate-binding protein
MMTNKVKLIGLLCIVVMIVIIKLHNREHREHFTRRFFRPPIPTVKIHLMDSTKNSSERQLTQLLSQMVPYNLIISDNQNVASGLSQLNSNSIQFQLIPSHMLMGMLQKTMSSLAEIPHQNLRSVASLYSLPVTFLTSSTVMSEFGDLRGSKLRINVGPKGSPEHTILMDLLIEYQLSIGDDVVLSHIAYNDNDTDNLVRYFEDESSTTNGIDVVMMIVSHPNAILNRLSNLRPTRLISLDKLGVNSTFFKPKGQLIPMYQSISYDKRDLAEYYPNLNLDERKLGGFPEPVVGAQSQFISTIGIQMYLISNRLVSTQSVAQLLYNLKYNLDEVNRLRFIDPKMTSATLADLTLPIPLHLGTQSMLRKSGLITNISNPACPLINGKCTLAELSRHKLLPIHK